jgi:ABC-type dipeptide/oligopeptide/nickel transport system ATPase component
LAEGLWINDRESVILIGDSGTGKTHCETPFARAADDPWRPAPASPLGTRPST